MEDDLKPSNAPEDPETKPTPGGEEDPEPTPSLASPEEPAPSEPDEPAPSEPEKPSRRESLRIKDLLAQNRKLKEATAPSPLGIDYSKDLEADPEIVERLTADKKAAVEAAFNQGLERTSSIQFHTRLEVDAPRIEGKYPQLDKRSPKFHPAVADAINTAYLSAVGYDAETDTVRNPGLRYADYVEGMFELADEIAGEKVEATATNVAKQAAQTGLRPDGSQAKRLNLNKAAEDMSDEELAAKLAQMGLGTPKK